MSKILTWFFDSPSPLSPFSVHRMALAGKELGKDVGQWFVPSTAAGAIKCVNDNALLIRSLVDLSSEPLSSTSQNHPFVSTGLTLFIVTRSVCPDSSLF